MDMTYNEQKTKWEQDSKDLKAAFDAVRARAQAIVKGVQKT